MNVVSHPTGNTFVRALVEGLQREGDWPFEFHTTIGFATRGISRLPKGFREAAERRGYAIESKYLYCHPGRELVRLVAARQHWSILTMHECGWASVDAVYQSLDNAVAKRIERRKDVRCVYAYEDGALKSFLAAGRRGARTLYNLPIAYWETSRRLLSEEAARLPEWEPTLMATRDSNRKLERKTRELEAANVIICPSAFVLRSLPESVRNTKRCVVIPFGSPGSSSAMQALPKPPSRPLRVLFAGSMSQRKGLADVFTAFRLLNRSDVELVVMGSLIAGMDFYRRQCPNFVYEPPRSHSAVMKLMRTCDVLVLPSIVEGRALVQQEAMICELPLLVTSNAGAEDLIEEGITGFLVPIRAAQCIAERLNWFADHRDQLEEMGRAAARKASALTWDAYWGAHRPLFLSTS